MVVGGELFENHGAALLLTRQEPPLSIVPGSTLFGLKLSKGLDHPRDEGIVLPFLHGVDLGLDPVINCERHKSWDSP